MVEGRLRFGPGRGIKRTKFAQRLAQVFIIPQPLFRSCQDVGRDSCLLDENILHSPHNLNLRVGDTTTGGKSGASLEDKSRASLRQVSDCLRQVPNKSRIGTFIRFISDSAGSASTNSPLYLTSPICDLE